MGRLSDALFDGETFIPARDQPRLSGQLAAVKSAMSDYRWYTIKEIATRCSGSEAGVSARLNAICARPNSVRKLSKNAI